MGTYFNPGNNSFTRAVKSSIYLDKTGLLEELNMLIGTEDNCIALSHARRFGKSQAVGMLDAYYIVWGVIQKNYSPMSIR